MIRSQKGAVGLFTLALVALLALTAGVFYYVQNKTVVQTGYEEPVKSSTPKEVKNDSDASQVDASLNSAAKVNMEDSKATSSDLGL